MQVLILIAQILGLLAELYPKLSPAVADFLSAMKSIFSGEQIPDITQEEFEARIDAAIAALPPWK